MIKNDDFACHTAGLFMPLMLFVYRAPSRYRKVVRRSLGFPQQISGKTYIAIEYSFL